MKQILIKVYRPNGELLKVLDNATFQTFSKELNGGLGPCTIELGEKFDYSGEDLKLNNDVEIIISDKDTVGTSEGYKVIYKGYISKYTLWTLSNKEKIEINLLGYYTKLAQDIWKSGTTIIFDNIGSAKDIGTQFRELMDRYIAETSNPKLSYNSDTIKTTGTTTEYKFEKLTYRQGIDILKSLAPANWFWYVGESGMVYFKSKPTTATHKFILGRHFSGIVVERSMEKIKNAVLFYSDNLSPALLKLYTDPTSVQGYGRRITQTADNRVGVITDADKIAESYVAEHKDPDIRVTAEIIDNNESDLGYDIESINPGDTCTFYGFDESLADIFKENMLITRVDYSLNKATITIEPLKAGIIKRTEDISGRVGSIEGEGVPTVYTT